MLCYFYFRSTLLLLIIFFYFYATRILPHNSGYYGTTSHLWTFESWLRARLASKGQLPI